MDAQAQWEGALPRPLCPPWGSRGHERMLAVCRVPWTSAETRGVLSVQCGSEFLGSHWASASPVACDEEPGGTDEAGADQVLKALCVHHLRLRSCQSPLEPV